MKTELKRRDQAIGHLFRRLNEVASMDFWNQVHEEVKGLLNPVEYEEVPVERWECAKCGRIFKNSVPMQNVACGFDNCDGTEYFKLTGTVKREKKSPVEYTLTLSLEEAETLLRVCQKIGGSPHRSRRRHTDRIGALLRQLGVEDPGQHLTDPSSVIRFFEDPTT